MENKDTLQNGTAFWKGMSSDKIPPEGSKSMIFHTEPVAVHGQFHPIISENRDPVEKDADERLRKLCEKALRKRYGREQQGEAEKKLAWELAALRKKGMAPLFLFCREWMDEAGLTAWDICGRGNLGCSMVAYLIGITDIDPFRYDLAPEFFFGYDGEKDVDVVINIPSSLRKKVEETANIREGVFTVYRAGKNHISFFLHDVLEILRRLSKSTGVKLSDIPYDAADDAMGLFCTDKGIRRNPAWGDLRDFQSEYGRILMEKAPLKTFDDWVRFFCLIHGTWAWQEMGEAMWGKSGNELAIFSSPEDLFDACLRAGIPRKEAFQIAMTVKLGKASPDWYPEWRKMRKTMLDTGIKEQRVNACEKTRYLFPKAHAIAYVQMYRKAGWFRTHYEQEYRQVLEEYEKAGMKPVRSDIKY